LMRWNLRTLKGLEIGDEPIQSPDGLRAAIAGRASEP
jgi:hypothetical protein